MNSTRRSFFQTVVGTGFLGTTADRLVGNEKRGPSYAQLERAAAAPVVSSSLFKSPVKIASMELLRNGHTFLVRVRSTDGAEGIAVPNASRLRDSYPIFLNRVAPFFLGKDARELDFLVGPLGVYRYKSNYKFQGLAFWVCVAAAEFAVLDLLGKLTDKSIGDLLGGVRRRDVAVYRASGNRGNRPEEEIEYLKKLVAETGAKAIKFRVGGRMSNNADSLPGRTEALIPLVRKTFGDEMAIYADSNSSYDAYKAIEVGRLMEKYNFGFFEEPCRFDHLEETKQVADTLKIPVAGGEQEFSMRRFRWMIYHRAVDIVQPDIHYFGGFIRTMRVARMAAEAGLFCTPHMSGSGLGYLDVAHMISCIPKPGPYHEFKGNSNIPMSCDTSSLKCENGVVRVPSGPGFGITFDPVFVRNARKVTTI